MSAFEEPIVAIRLNANGHTGITLFAPPWTDADGEEWQGFLGDGSKIVLFGNPDELNTWLGDHPDHDLADHPSWPSFAKKGKNSLRPADDAHFDLDAVFELAAADPEPETTATLADTVDMAARIADCCEDGKLRALLTGTREYLMLTDADTSYEGKAGQLEWRRLGDVISESWDRAMDRVESWLRWEGSSKTPIQPDEDAEDEANDE